MIESEEFAVKCPEVGEVPKSLVEENTEKLDSGMDEDSNSPDSMAAGNSSDDEEEVVARKPKKMAHRILDDDSDDNNDVPALKDSPERRPLESRKTAEEVLAAVLESSSEDDEPKEPVTSAKKKHIKRPAMDDSSSDEEQETLLASIKKRESNMAGIFDAEDSVDTPEMNLAPEETAGDGEDLIQDKDEPPKLPDDLFDADESDKSDNSDSAGSDAEDEDEGFDESKINPALLAKLKKGAAKQPKTGRGQRGKKPEVQEIHSESQRLVREARVSLPYHQPAPRSLNDFLARANKKQQEYKILRGARDFTKAKVLEKVLETTRVQSKPKSQEDLDKFSDSDTEWTPETEKEQDQKDKVDKWLEKYSPETDGVSVDGKAVSGSEEVTECETDNLAAMAQSAASVEVDEDCGNELPDIGPESQVVCVSTVPSLPSGQDSPVAVEDSEKGNIEQSEDMDCSLTKETDGSSMDITETAGPVCDNDSEAVLITDKHTTCTPKETEESSETDKENVPSPKLTKVSKSNDLGGISDNLILKTQTAETDNSADQESADNSKLTKSKLAALVESQISNVTPRLNSGLETFISLDDGESAPLNPGVAKLMDRLCQHHSKREKLHSKDMNISVVQKDVSGEKEELTLNTFTYHETEHEENPLMKLEIPGAKLVALKEKLKEGMKERREIARQKRQDMYDLDNEEGGYKGGDEEEEAEMTDHSDTDVEEEDFEEQFGGEEEEEEEEKEDNPFADDEAEEEEGEEAEGGEEEMNLKLDVSDEEDEEKSACTDDEDTAIERSKSSQPAATSSVSDTESEVRASASNFKEPEVADKPFSMFGSRNRESSIGSDSQLQSGQRTYGLVMPIEDSQDLCGNTMPALAPTQPDESQPGSSFNFFLEDSQSQMLDAEGYLKVKSTGKKPPKPVGLDDLSGTQDNMDELLGLCSGRFAATQGEGKEKNSRKSLFEEGPVKATQSNMDELMGLCSGVFTDSKSDAASQKLDSGRKRKMSASEDEESHQSFDCLSDNEERQSDKEKLTDDEDGDTDAVESDDEEGDEAMDEVDGDDAGDGDNETRHFKGFTVKNKHGKIRKEFLEDEAELSGSEFDSDENLDLAEEEDIMMLEEGDKDTAAMDEDKLRNEVGRVHLKQMIDEDKRELVRFQEMYLPDGDLHSEGGGRTRRFKWSNVDDDTQQDMFGADSDDNGAEEEHENDFKWRKERFEREKWLKEQQEKENDDIEENSNLLQLGKVFLKRKCSVDSSQTKMAAPDGKKDAPGTPTSFYKLSKQKRGSFLARSKQDLEKIAGMTKPVVDPSAGAKSSGKFVFQVISPDKNTEEPAQKPKQRTARSASQKPAAKKPKLDTQASFDENSIFNHL